MLRVKCGKVRSFLYIEITAQEKFYDIPKIDKVYPLFQLFAQFFWLEFDSSVSYCCYRKVIFVSALWWVLRIPTVSTITLPFKEIFTYYQKYKTFSLTLPALGFCVTPTLWTNIFIISKTGRKLSAKFWPFQPSCQRNI